MTHPDASTPAPSPDELPAAATAKESLFLPATASPAERLAFYQQSIERFIAADPSPDAADFADWGEAHFELARMVAELPEKLDHYRLAAEKYTAAVALKRTEATYPVFWVHTILRMARLLDPASHAELYLRQSELYARALLLRPSPAQLFHETGAALQRIATATKEPAGKRLLCELALEKATAASEASPDDAHYLCRCGIALTNLSRLAADEEEKTDILHQAADRYAQAISKRPDNASYYRFWAFTLSDLANLAPLSEKVEIYRQSAEKLRAAAELKPSEPSYFHDWGSALSLAGSYLEDPVEQQETYLQAHGKFQTALGLDPDRTPTRYKLAVVLTDLGDLAPDPDQSRDYYLRACEHFRITLQQDPEQTGAHEHLGTTLRDLANLSTGDEEKLGYFMEGSDHFRAITVLKPRTARNFTNWGMLLHDQAEATEDEPAQLALFREAAEKFTQALDLDSSLHGPRHGLANALLDMAHLSEAAESLPLLDEAIIHFAAALDDSDCRHQVLLHWADALCDRGTLLADDPDAAIPPLRESIAKYAEAAMVKPDSYYTYFNWGDALLELYYRIPDDQEEETALLVGACAKFTRAHHLHPDWTGAPARVAMASEMLARRVDDTPEKIRLYRRAARYWELLTRLEPQDSGHFQSWGTALREQAGLTLEMGNTAERERLLIRAGNLFSSALRLDPQLHSARVKWAGVLMDRADDIYDLTARQALLSRSRRKIRQSITGGYPRAYFHLARLEARGGNLTATLAALDQWRRHDSTASRHWVATNPDFDILKGHPTFEAFLESLK